VLALGDRDCSLQRRHQKVIEEAPAPNVDQAVRARLHRSAVDLAREVGLRGIATCEFLLGEGGEIAFLEINPRIQVEHPVTELVSGIDLVEWQLRIAAGNPLPMVTGPSPRGHAVEARVYAEDPATGFLPSAGALSVVSWPHRAGIRIDAGYASGDTVPTVYDAMLAKVIAHGADRDAAIASLRLALSDSVVAGVATNLAWLDALLASDAFTDGRATTSTASTITARSECTDVARLAVLAELTAGSAATSEGAWGAIGAWRVSGAVPVVLHGDDWETRFRIVRDGDAWLVDDGAGRHRVRWLRGADGVWSITRGDRHLRAGVSPRDGGYLATAAGGARWLVHVGSRPRAAAKRAGRSGSGNVTAPMPASVTRVHVAPGDRVDAGQPLVTLTAMKMELTCEAPFAGTVAEVHCEAGELVDSDRVLAIVSPNGTGTPDEA
jgi:acetyl/propionyl-CoA carboxylase alpha subunit